MEEHGEVHGKRKRSLGLRRAGRRAVRPHAYSHPFELRRKAVQLCLEEGFPVAQVARDLGIGFSTLGAWVRRYRAQGEAGLQGEVRRQSPRPQVAATNGQSDGGRVKYRALIRAVKTYAAMGYDGLYLDSVTRPEWQRLPMLTNQEILNIVITFLNKWRCRIPKTVNVATALSEAFRDTASLIDALQGPRLEDIDLASLVEARSERLTCARAIAAIFDRLVAVGSRFSHVAAVKTMHMANPGLFVMWDNDILAGQGHRQEPYGWFHAYKFLPGMQAEANELFEDYRTLDRVSREAAVRGIEKECGGRKTLAKLIDEYNYIRRPRRWNPS
jgi:transposase